MGFLSLEKFVETAPTGRLSWNPHQLWVLKKTQKNPKETQIRVKGYRSSPNSLHHSPFLKKRCSCNCLVVEVL